MRSTTTLLSTRQLLRWFGWLLLLLGSSYFHHTFAIAKSWTGATSSDWNTASNWNPAGVPTQSDYVSITGNGVNAPRITAGTSVTVLSVNIVDKTLTISTGGELYLRGDGTDFAYLYQHGNTTITNNGTLAIESANGGAVPGYIGLDAASDNLINSGLIRVNSSTGYALQQRDGNIINQTCGQILFIGSGAFSRESFINNGYFRTSFLRAITNNGVLRYDNGGPPVNNNGSLVVNGNSSPASPIFTYTGTFTGTVNSIYKDAAATASAGSFTAPNSFIASGLPAGSQTLYAKITPSGGACSYVVPFTYNNVYYSIRYVKQGSTGNGTSWSDASGDMQANINADGAQQVWVAGGRYTRTGGGSFAMKNGVAIYGGFTGTETSLAARPTVNPVGGQLSSTTLTVGSGGGSVISNNGLTATARLDGVVITGGRAGSGGGLYNVDSSPTITNCAITNNIATSSGGFRSGGGGIFNSNSSPSFTNCAITNNTTPVGIGGGVYNFASSSPSFTNCLLAGNSANLGGAIFNGNSSPRLTGCTLTANRAGAGAALINYTSSQPQLTNCILWNNQEDANTSINNDNGTGVTASYCLIGDGENDFTGNNNLVATTSPFVSTTDFQLSPCSVAINAGDPASTTTTSGTTDLAGNPRFFQSGRIDIGAYEYQGTPAQPVAITQQPASSSSVTVGANVSVPVIVSGSVSTYQWYKDNLSNAVSGQTSATLTLSNVQTSDAGSYSLVVTGTCNSVTSTAFNLSVSPAVTGAPVLSSPASGTTTNGLPTFAGSGPASSSVRVIISGTAALTLTTTATAGGTFSVSPGSPLASGSYAVYAMAMTNGQTTSAPSATNNFTVDSTAPSVSLSSTVANNAISPSSPVSFTATFSESVSGFSASGISVSNGSVSDLSGSGTSYSFQVTATTAGQATSVQVRANAAQDGVGNANTASTTYGFTYQQPMTGAPTLSSPANGTIINTPTPTYTGTAPTGSQVSVFVDNQFIGQTQAATGGFALTQPGALPDGPHQVYATAQISGQTNSMASAINSFTVDTTRPSVSLTSTQVTNGGTTTSAAVAFSASFSEPVSGFSTSGISVSNGSVSDLTGNGASYTFQVTATGSGTVRVQVLANAAQDAAGNPNFASSPYGFTYQPTPTTFAITGARVTDCVLDDPSRSKRYRVSLQPQYAGQDTSQPISFSVANELSATTAPGPYTLLLWGDNQQITLVAKQPNSAEARFAYRWQADCPAINGGTPPPNQPQPPTTTGIPNQSATVNQAYSLDVSPYFSDPTGQPLTYTSTALPAGLSLSGSVISGVPSQSGVYGITVTATDPDNLTVASSFQLTINGTPVNPPNPPAGFSITGARITDCVLDNAADSKRYQVSLQPQYAGQDTSQPISFSVANELSATTAPGPYTLLLWGDNQQITLVAKQPNSTEARFAYRWQADCPAINGAPRRGVQAEAGTGLQVRLLGNPVTDGQLRLELRGVAGQSAELRLLSPAGRLLSQTPIESVVEGEPLTLGVRADWGSLLLLQVSSGSQQQTLKVVQVR